MLGEMFSFQEHVCYVCMSRQKGHQSVLKCFLMSWSSYKWTERYVAHAEQAGMGGVRKQPKAVVLTLIVFIFSLRRSKISGRVYGASLGGFQAAVCC